jgi:universal stress protein F
MIQKILVPLPVDAANSRSEALAMAVNIAKSNSSKIILLHVNEIMPGYVSSHLPADFTKKAVEASVADLTEAAKNHWVGDDVEIVVRDGNPAAEILEYANDAAIDMIVMASHDPGLADYLLGSVAARVVRHAHCSVLVVRHPKD